MRAAIYKGEGKFQIENVSRPEISGPEDVIIKIIVCGICGTDVAMTAPNATSDMSGKILGHEIVGEVFEIGTNVKNLSQGDQVVVNPNSFCGICDTCRMGLPNHCENMELMGITHSGGFAEFVKIQAKQVFRISSELPLKYAVFAEPLACAINGFTRLNPQSGASLLVIGCGPIGMLFANMARNAGTNVICLEPNERRLEIARECGFKVYSPFNGNIQKCLLDDWKRPPEYIIDAAGQLGSAIELAGFKTRILAFAPTKECSMDPAPIQSKELTIVGSFIINHTMPKAIELLENEKMVLDPLISHVLPLGKLTEGIDLMRSGEGMKIILNIQET